MRRRKLKGNARRRTGLIVGLVLSVAVLPACGSDDGPGNYVSIGDSYAQGFRLGVDGETPDFTNGFAYLLPDKAGASGWDLNLENFACGGATVESMMEEPGCPEVGLSPGGPPYEVPQIEAAIDFLKEHPDHVELITVVIGANDVILPCATKADDQMACVTDAIAPMELRLAAALADLRAAAGPDTVIIGVTYPAMTLGSYVDGGDPELATEWVTAFKDIINPMLKKQYEAIDAIFVDVTDGTAAYAPFTETTTLDPYGEIPVAVAEVCQLTWSCEGDVHPTDAGHEAIADLIVEALPAPPTSD